MVKTATKQTAKKAAATKKAAPKPKRQMAKVVDKVIVHPFGSCVPMGECVCND